MSEFLFYLRDTRSNIGSSCMFWRKNGAGYGSSLDEAELFSLEKAQKIMNESPHFVALEKESVDSLCLVRVDHQYLSLTEIIDETQFYIQRNIGEYDGNDIFFETHCGNVSQNLNESGVFTINSAFQKLKEDAGKIWPKTFIDSISRRIITTDKIDLKKMALKYGVKIKKKKKKKETSGKTRHNCPTCGKIVWSFNPYDAPYCNIFCEP